MEKKDYCTWFPDVWLGMDISECCKRHDDTLGTHDFYQCLKSKIGWFHALYITAGGAIGAWVKYPLAMKKKI